jgi:cell division inhibitor SepF
MASIWQKAMFFLGLEDELEPEGQEYVTAEHPAAAPVEVTGGRRVEPPAARWRPGSETVVEAVGGGVRSVPAAESQVEILVAYEFADAQLLADHLRDRRPVALDLREASSDTVRRLVDFASGITYALDGTMQRIADGVILVTPSRTILTNEQRDRLAGLGLYEPTS